MSFNETMRLKRGLFAIRANAESQLRSMDLIGTMVTDPAYINARWTYAEANAALSGE